MSRRERIDETIRIMNEFLDMGRLFGKAEAYEFMLDLLKKSHFKTSNPKLVLNTVCLSLDSLNDSLEKAKNFIKDSSPTMAQQIDTMINTVSVLTDDVRISVGKGKYEEAFKRIRKTSPKIDRFVKENEITFQVFEEVCRKRLEDMFR